ncbi:MAG: hypothetical protein P3A28_08835, partial [Gemmatimonadota bacterium]|nr:hypothetical protein [Gemmatimonadota bacterium]
SDKAARDAVTLFKPATATRVRYSMYTDTPMPVDEPMAENPPDGAVIEYRLAANASGPVKLEIVGEKGRVIRTFSSTDKFDPPQDDGNAPWYWFRVGKPLPATAGIHRMVWDLHYERPTGQPCSLPISATPRQTKCEPEGPFVAPGPYTARLTVGDQAYTQTFAVRMDPRVKASATAIAQQTALSLGLYDAHETSVARQATARELRAALADRKTRTPSLAAAIDSLDAKIVAIAGAGGAGGRGGRGGGRGGAPAAGSSGETFASTAASVLGPLNVLQDADEQPVTAVVAGATERITAFKALEARWAAVTTDLTSLNLKFKAAGLGEIAVR